MIARVRCMLNVDTSLPGDCLATSYEVLEGWFEGTGELFHVRLDGQEMAHQSVPRPDLGEAGQGFRVYLDMTKLVGRVAGSACRLEIVQGGKVVAETALAIADDLPKRMIEAKQWKADKRRWLLQHLRLQNDGAGPVLSEGCNTLRFSEGGVSFDQAGHGALNLLEPSFGFSGHLSAKADGVSAHPYPSLLEDMLAAERRDGFMALDFGAGFKRIERPDVVYMEIFDYPSSDLLAVGQALPFADETFDMVITLAVLEHVDDPFACGGEILRVLKPGGVVFSGIPFMQPEHGYPDHYFNATRSGHRRLYRDELDIVSHTVDDHQHPFLSLQWILRSYLLGLPEEARRQMSAMTVDELLRQRYWASRREPFIAELGETAQWELASATTLVGRKKP
ncbi:class I SAM-dependent methyltransferase [Aurantimonas sp. VKM B-3413]|uniref:class I SAM-dependent methyltransferase n=1 Tax=Aurantimonas sp. VKM B-3413 TaxID=2779401 RepID=UPI001E565E0F|nr:class I SAM-dependent methyltransferase [Aurantimonas sp. VKM B-3413]MCB8839385.1 class I SAM-dependent methyltransferase [Aurantimonas sp. VKM B-3413]